MNDVHGCDRSMNESSKEIYFVERSSRFRCSLRFTDTHTNDDDNRVRMASVLVRHFVEELVDDAWAHHNLRQCDIPDDDRDKTMREQDVASSLRENRITVTKPDFFVDS